VSESSTAGAMMYKAFIDRISHSMVYLLHDSPAAGATCGTAFLASLNGSTYIVSALYNFTHQGKTKTDIFRTWNETRFKFRDRGTLRFREDGEIPAGDFVLVPGVRVSARTLVLINKVHDIIAVRLEPGEVLSPERATCLPHLRRFSRSGKGQMGSCAVWHPAYNRCSPFGRDCGPAPRRGARQGQVGTWPGGWSCRWHRGSGL
jgi:hypothetical protein